jgi:hypothetical protein
VNSESVIVSPFCRTGELLLKAVQNVAASLKLWGPFERDSKEGFRRARGFQVVALRG